MIILLVSMKLLSVKEFSLIKKSVRQFSLAGSLQGISYTTYLLAISAGPVAYAIAIRSSNILMGSLLGILLFQEKLTSQKAVSMLFIITGIVTLALAS